MRALIVNAGSASSKLERYELAAPLSALGDPPTPSALDDDSPIETSPVVWNCTMYVTSAHDHVYALDAKTGALKWKFTDRPHVIAFAANRGVALADGHVFLGTLDGHLISLDATTGKKVCDVVGVHDTKNSSYTMQPVPYKNMLLMGVSNGDWGGLGYVTAFDQTTGKRVWEWKTVPGPGEAGHETWSADSWKRGGAAVWSGLAVEEKSDTLYMDLGNPQPDFFGESRKGDNLYSNSMVALDISGVQPKIKRYYRSSSTIRTIGIRRCRRFAPARRSQAPNANSSSQAIRAATSGCSMRRMVSSSTTKRSVRKKVRIRILRVREYRVPQYERRGRIQRRSVRSADERLYVPSVDECGVWKKLPRATYLAGRFYLGGLFPPLHGPNTGWMNAIDMSTGEFACRKKESLPALGGALATSSGLVFSGMLTGHFEAFDAKTGKIV